jgi:hypothetical protein
VYALTLSGQSISKAQAQKRMYAKLANLWFLLDMQLPADEAEGPDDAAVTAPFTAVYERLIERMPGDP